MVIPRSRSKSMSSRICSLNSRSVMAPARMSRRSDKVLLPWSMWAMMEKLRICMNLRESPMLRERCAPDKWKTPGGAWPGEPFCLPNAAAPRVNWNQLTGLSGLARWPADGLERLRPVLVPPLVNQPPPLDDLLRTGLNAFVERAHSRAQTEKEERGTCYANELGSSSSFPFCCSA